MASESLRAQIARRAGNRCEYCHLPEECSVLPFEVEHIIALKHGGQNVMENLAYACRYCNAYKGANIAGIDPRSHEVVPLFNPRLDAWTLHFRWNGVFLVGLTAEARATVEVLRINHPAMLALRRSLVEEGVQF